MRADRVIRLCDRDLTPTYRRLPLMPHLQSAFIPNVTVLNQAFWFAKRTSEAPVFARSKSIWSGRAVSRTALAAELISPFLRFNANVCSWRVSDTPLPSNST